MDVEGDVRGIAYFADLIALREFVPVVLLDDWNYGKSIQTQQFIILFSSTCFGLTRHNHVVHKIQRIYIYIVVYAARNFTVVIVVRVSISWVE
jgi:hypothetical protein